VLTNLLSNACKYTASGRVALELSRAGGELVFAVRDSGTGMGPDEVERLFEPFVTSRFAAARAKAASSACTCRCRRRPRRRRRHRARPMGPTTRRG
jgi:signal transduction histidine kinase